MSAIDLLYARRRRAQRESVPVITKPCLSLKMFESAPPQPDWRGDPEQMALDAGFQEQGRTNSGDFGYVVRYLHPRGDNLIITRRRDVTKPVSQQAAWQDRLRGVSSQWDTKWDHHSYDGVKSTGFDVFGLQNHLRSFQ